jgi:SSS family solute:Na+ symporter
MGYAAFFIYFLFFFVGALLYVYFKGLPFDQPNEIILRFANSLAIPGLMGILAAAVLSASMSSLSSAFNSLATISITDIYQSFLKKDGSDSHYLKSSRVMTLFWGIMVIPMAFAFISSEGSILEVLSKVASYFVGAKLAMFGMGFFSKHTTQRGLLIGVAAGFLGLLIIVGVFNIKGIYHNIAWPWYVVIGGGINITVSWVASIALDGFQKDWHPQTVIGQIQDFKAKGKNEKQDGWYLMPGRAEAPVWGLLGLFIIIIIFLSWFSTLG